MKKLTIRLLLLAFLGTGLISFNSCRDEKSTGEKVEENMEEAGDEIEEGAEELEDEIDDATDDH